MVPFPTSLLHEVTQLHLTCCTVDAAHERVCPENRGYTIGGRVSGERLIALCPNGPLYAEIYGKIMQDCTVSQINTD